MYEIKAPAPIPKETTSIQISGITKKYGNFCALNNIDITINKGEVHSLVGQNGAGKSTLLGILSGRVSPTSGSVNIFGESLHFADPRSSRKLGVFTIFQELTILPNLTAVENVFLGQNISKRGFVSQSKMNEKFKELCEIMNVQIPPRSLARQLSVADQQVVEIMRGLQSEARVLILDEPTASLGSKERKSLLETIKSLRSKGISIIYVSHHLDEVLEISDTITVLRNGEKITTQPKGHWTKEKLVTTMLGNEVENETILNSRISSKDKTELGEIVLQAKNVTVPGALEKVNLTIHAGEIVGIGGLVGSGRSTLVRALAGLEPHSSGELWMNGTKVKWPRNPRYSIKLGIALAPEDRKHQGLVLGLPCYENIAMIDYEKVSKFGVYQNAQAKEVATSLGEKFGLTRPVDTLCRNLSGGNQQKVLLSKVCNLALKVLIVDEPTRGIDLGVKIEVLKILRQLASEGMAVILISSELEEVVSVSDRVLVLSKGKLVSELTDDDISVGNILHTSFKGVTA